MMNNNTKSSTAFFKNFKNVSIEDDEKVTSRGRPEDVPKRRHIDVPMWSSMQHVKRHLLPVSWVRPIATSSGRWNMTSWRRPNLTSWGHSHIALYVTPRDVPTEILRTSSSDVMRMSPHGLICNSKGCVLPTSWGRPSEVSRGHPKDVLIWIYISKAKNCPRDKDFCIWS